MHLLAMTFAAGMSTACKSRAVFAAAVMAGIAGVAMLIMRRIGMETVEGLLATPRKWSVVAVTGIVAIVDMAIKAMRPVKPGAGPNEYTASKPIGPVVAIGRTIIRSIGEVAIGAYWSHADVDSYLRRCTRRAAQHGRSECRNCKNLQIMHQILLQPQLRAYFGQESCNDG
jgi:hypothetical protein